MAFKKMLSPLSLQFLAGPEDSNSSAAGSGNSGQKRRLAASAQSVRPDNSLSGYSADREESSASPPMGSIDVDANDNNHGSVREMNSCPKRQKRNELQFAASSVKADLARAGIEFSTVDPTIGCTTTLESVPISLKGVQLMHSKEFQKKPFVTTSGVNGSVNDYQALIAACSSSYPSSLNRSALSNEVVTSSQDSVRSTSSVSESDTDSVTSKSNSANDSSVVIPPLFNDSVDENNAFISTGTVYCNVMSSASNVVTMCETLELTKSPRYVFVRLHVYSIHLQRSTYLVSFCWWPNFSGLLH